MWAQGGGRVGRRQAALGGAVLGHWPTRAGPRLLPWAGANPAMSSVRPHEQGIASGANNAPRKVGGALGIAVMPEAPRPERRARYSPDSA